MGCDMYSFRLSHENPDLFHRSEWDSPKSISCAYVFWQIDGLGFKMMIYLTNQGFFILTIHYVLYAFIVIFRFMGYNPKVMPFLYKLSWAFQNMSSTAALFITIVYWSVLHPMITYPTTTGLLFSILLHMFNTITCLVDIFINARPINISHFYFASFFGMYYALFSIIYWVLGGTGGLDCDIQ